MDEKMLGKIEALLRKAERTNVAAEADTFYAKAFELMEKYSISEAMLRHGKKDRAGVTTKTLVLNKSGYWKSNLTLIQCLARPNDVQILVTVPRGKGDKPIVHMIGFPEDISSLELLYTSMLIQNTRLRRQMMPKDITVAADKYRWIKSFIEGFAYRIEGRLAEMKRMAQQAAEAQYGASNLLPVLASKSVVVKDELQRLFPRTKPLRASRAARDYDGMAAGREAADRADIGQKRVGSTKELGA